MDTRLAGNQDHGRPASRNCQPNETEDGKPELSCGGAVDSKLKFHFQEAYSKVFGIFDRNSKILSPESIQYRKIYAITFHFD